MNWACLLSDESKGVLLAGEETERLAHRYIRTEHLTLGPVTRRKLVYARGFSSGPACLPRTSCSHVEVRFPTFVA